jgi:hypothetical protein
MTIIPVIVPIQGRAIAQSQTQESVLDLELYLADIQLNNFPLLFLRRGGQTVKSSYTQKLNSSGRGG